MADEVPVSDVLCEAMEYLAKLGTNLRNRSEALKDKKINKDKLKNSHAVQKAANKVLLICELSKKSLDNVETGVRRLLNLVDAAQASTSVGGKGSTHDMAHPFREASNQSKSVKTQFQYFDYKSRKLRISQNVPLKHYMSVKVRARNMPLSMQDKYPVYYDCKLFRLRRRDSIKRRIQHARDNMSANKDSQENQIDKRQGSPEKDGFADLVELDKVEPVNSNLSDLDIKDKLCPGLSATSPKPESDDMKGEKCHSKEKKDQSKERRDSNCSLDSTKRDSKNEKINSHKKVSQSDESSDSKNSNDKQKRVKKNVQKRLKRILTIDDSSDSSVDTQNPAVMSIKEPESQILEPQDNILEHNQKEVVQNTDPSQDFESNCSDSNIENKPIKPLIKCVNISKLLKPQVLEKEKEIVEQNTQKSTDTFPEKVEIAINKDNNKNERNLKRLRYNDEETFWTQKRKKVKSFKAKEFTIKVIRLPKITLDFLQTNNLKKITSNGSVVCEVGVQIEKSRQTEVESDKNSLGKESVSLTVIDKVKNDLLNDSDSDKSENSPNNHLNCESEKSIAVYSDSDKNKKHQDSESAKWRKEKSVDSSEDSNASKNDSQKSKEKSKLRKKYMKKTNKEHSSCDPEKVKSALLNESDSDEDIHKSLSKESKSKDNKSKRTVRRSDDEISETAGETTPKNSSEKNECKDKSDQQQENVNPIDTENTFPSCEVEKVKSALLNESDSDNNEEQANSYKCESEKVVNDETDNDLDGNIDKDNCTIETDTQRSAKTPDKEVSSPTCEPEKVNSSSDNPKRHKRKRQDSSSPSKRKHIRESMHAKKMLLTYSSSSGTEDEQLKKVFKEIKDELLKEGSSDEAGTKKDNQKQLHSTSDSDEDILHRMKKKRKTRKSKKSSQTSSEEESLGVNKKKAESEESENAGGHNSDHDDGSQLSQDEKSNTSSTKMGRSREKPGASSSHSSDSPDDKDIDGLTNLNTLNKGRRRRDSAKPAAKSSKGDKMSKAPPLITGEGLLEAPSSSDEASGDNDAVDEELPPVVLSGLNGDSVGHMAKDDLLGETDSSSSSDKEKSSEEIKKDEDSDDDSENVKLKRRKAHAISSDSEVGSSRRKGADMKMSDFEDSDEDHSEPGKRSKRKKVIESDASDGSSDGGKKKRRRIKPINDSDASGSDTENEGRNKHGRKNIRKVMGKNQLEEATKKAARQEKERMARIAERQKMYNNMEFDESGKPDEVVLDKVILDFDPETKEPLIEVDRGLVKKLKPHQANGIKFMWDACFESVKRIKKDKGSGCILAHCMGLGKTLQVVSLTHTLLTHGELTGVNRVLVVCPLSTVLNWVNEFKMWLKHAVRDYEVDVYELSRYKQNSERAYQLSQWFSGGGVCVLGYEMFRNLSADNNKKFKKKMLRNFQEALVDPGPDMVVCDEGHLLKNEKTSLSQSMNRVKTLRRIVLTGTPLQNNLKEYYCMVQFVKPNLLGKYNEYLNRFVNPITNGQYTDSTEHDIRVMKRRSHVLHKMLDGAVQRRDYGVLAPFLPPKHEYVLFITLTEVQTKLYQHYLENYSRRPLPGKSSGFLFPDFQSLQRIWTHPLVLKYNSERYEIMQQKKRDREEEDSEGSLVDFIDDDSTPDESSTEESTDDSSDVSDDSRKKSKKKSKSKKKAKESKVTGRRGTRANPIDQPDVEEDNDVIEVKNENPTEWWIPLVNEDVLEDMRNSHKLVLLFEILRQCEAIGDKLLVFSQSLYSLDLIEHFLGKVDEATQEGRIDEKLGGHVGSWSPGVDYFRLDGSTSCENRSIWCKNFNREDNPRARLFLISTRAGGLGINLVAANRVVIFDVSWNPSHDVQSIFRVYRFGQKKPCYVYRFLAMGTMEEKIYERQVTKQAISKRVIDEQQIDRHYAENDLAELYKFEPTPPSPRPVPLVPKDRFFAEMLKEHEALIYKFHEHDSLLENKEEETLSEEERKAAWEDFENEKNKPPPAPFPNTWPMHNGMVSNMLAQQQQQLAYTALATMLRKEMPNVSDDQIRSMLPLIYGANPALMSKLGDMYKYAPPGMMNPGMMNPAMNAVGSGMGGGGTSGLQYEPPWQRQQQQQQQMRLQQLMQHQQSSMGAKYYSGGLGSRDPVAMALQQQRAREIMVGERGRPRGRPPLQPRAPTGDVVNLDSD